MQPLICIDFGSAFTKIGIRKSINQPSRLVKDSSLVMDSEHFCIPTLVAKAERGAKVEWKCGSDATTVKAGGGIQVYRNWKSSLFSGSSTPKLPGTTASRAASGRGITPETKEVALKFFQWVHKFLKPHCEDLGLEGVNQVPVRLNVPAINPTGGTQAGNSPGEKALLSILAEAGFCVDQACPLVTEPESNAIGIYTDGNNSTWQPHGPKGERRINFPGMFERGGYLAALHAHVVRRTHHRDLVNSHYRVFVIDIGAFTTDFALLEFTLDAETRRPDIRCQSALLGVQDLDAAVFSGLPEAKALKVNTLDSRRREEMKRSLYSDQAPYKLDVNTIVGAAGEAVMVQKSITRFAQRIVAKMDAFLAGQNVKKIHEVILTGGGNLIPSVCSALRDHILKSSLGTTLFQTPSTREVKSNPQYFHDSLKAKLVRGAGGIGGASVYFERQYW